GRQSASNFKKPLFAVRQASGDRGGPICQADIREERHRRILCSPLCRAIAHGQGRAKAIAQMPMLPYENVLQDRHRLEETQVLERSCYSGGIHNIWALSHDIPAIDKYLAAITSEHASGN